MTNNQLIGERLSNSDLEDLICELEAAGFYRRQLICLVELQERRKADSKPVAWVNGCNKSVPAALRYLAENPRPIGGESSFNTAHLYQLAREVELMAEAPLYRHAQPGPERDLSEWADMQFLLWDSQRRAGITDEQITQAMIEKLAVNKQRSWPEPKDGEPRLHIKEQPAPVVPDDVLEALQKVARIRLDLNDFDGDLRGIADCLSDAEEALIEVVNRCAAMLAAAPQEVK